MSVIAWIDSMRPVAPYAGSAVLSAVALATVRTVRVLLIQRQPYREIARVTSTEVVYGVTGTDVPELPEYGVLP